MALGSKYGSGCGCGGSGNSTKKFGITDCCGTPLQTAPSACCESHTTKCVAGICLTPTCDVIATTDGFFLAFSNVCPTDILPVDANNVYFYHPAAGLMQVVGFDGTYYKLNLVDPTKAGGLIRKTDCVLIAVVPSSVFANTTQRCVTGQFIAPALNQNQTIYIENGSSIPIGATIVFTFNGETGSYQVVSFVSSSNNVYVYEVQNTGGGLTPGVLVDGGCPGECPVPIDIITEVDLCDLAETSVADSITACVNGSPRALKPSGEGDVITGTDELTWELRKITNLDCCVVIDGCLKFSGPTCPDGTDCVVLRDINLDCFEEAWERVQGADDTPGGGQTNMPMNINGFPVVVTSYDSGSRVACFAPVNDIGSGIIQYDAGTQICLGECCASCLNGPQTTNPSSFGEGQPQRSALFAVNTFGTGQTMEYETGVPHYYLVGYQYGQDPYVVEVLELDNTYPNNPGSGPGKPLITDPLVIREKICHGQEHGCDLWLDAEFNYEIAFAQLPQGVRINWELGHFVQGSATLFDGTTPNPFFSISSQAAASGYVDGPANLDAQPIIGGTSIGYGNTTDPKVLPYFAGYFKDYIYLEKCNCAMSIVWMFVSSEVLPSFAATGNFDVQMTIRRRFKYEKANEVRLRDNDPDAEAWNT